ncbi:MarR family transcriptional regulator [Pseudoalteromonas rubra]|uniref:MarR family transcriptional regulator n=1 Tax=Pseudoalteromonas rubra TaxID=43658 RepID=A0A5S3WU44_9GAMM|nr:MarR family transcriptional regulator [Pseudoalteromonas rubra]TMP31779.1 MarR family transcriptional regulator [Pseudoalteromonas rubra]TMP33138.1 MarR family transcriptional regulator [Pseudoalteromonas rubra]
MAFDINEFLPYRMVRLANAMSEAFSEVYEQAGLTIPQWRVLVHLAQHPGATAKQLCDLASMDKSTVSRAIKQLQQQGMLVAQQSEADKRATEMTLTEQGTVLYETLTPEALVWESKLLSELNPDEKQALLATMKKLEGRFLL